MISFDWDNAKIVLKVPVHHTATKEIQEIEVTLPQLVGLLVSQMRFEDLPLAVDAKEKLSVPSAAENYPGDQGRPGICLE